MKIRGQQTPSRAFHDLKGGDAFLLMGRIYIKGKTLNVCDVNAVRLGDGQLIAVDEETEVEPVDAEVVRL